MKIAQLMALAALLGSIPFGYILLYLKSPKAARELGRNTSEAAVFGNGLFLLVFLLDCAKGFIPVYVAKTSLTPQWAMAAGVIAVFSAYYPYWFMFRPSRRSVGTVIGALMGLVIYIGK